MAFEVDVPPPPPPTSLDRSQVKCKFWNQANCWRGAKCPWKNVGKPQPQSAPTTDPMTQEQFANMSDLWLASRAAGVAKTLEVDQVAAEGMVLSALQVWVKEQSHSSLNSGGHDKGASELNTGIVAEIALMVVADTGATVRVIAGADRH